MPTEEQLQEIHRLAVRGDAAEIAQAVGTRLAEDWLRVSRFREVRELSLQTLALGPHAGTLIHLARSQHVLGEVEEALDTTTGLAPLYRGGDRADLAATLSNIGTVYEDLGEPHQALHYYHQVLPIVEEVGDRAGLATTLNNIGSVYDSLGDRQQALRYYHQVLPSRKRSVTAPAWPTTLNNIGSVYDSLGDPQAGPALLPPGAAHPARGRRPRG